MQGPPLTQRSITWALPAFLAGMELARFGPRPVACVVLLFGLLGWLAWLAAGPGEERWFRRRASLLLLGSLWLAFGFVRQVWEERRLGEDPVASCDGLRVDCSGTVLEPGRSSGGRLRFQMQVERVEGRPRWKAFPVLVLVSGRKDCLPNVAPGEFWRLDGRLEELPGSAYPGGFDQRAWARRRGIHHSLRVSAEGCERLSPPEGWAPYPLACRLRLVLLDSLTPHFRPDARALLAGIVLGDTAELPKDLEEAFRDTGTSHLLAASGMNVGIMVWLVTWVGGRLGYSKMRQCLPAMLMAGLYCLAAGCSPSILRATAMACFALLAHGFGRIGDTWQAFMLAILSILLVDPNSRHDLGFQLSVLAVLGILIYQEPLSALLKGPVWVRTHLSMTLSASLLVIPLLGWHFQEFPPATLVANLMLAPVAGILLPVGLITALLASLSDPLCLPLVGPTRFMLDYMIVTARWLAYLAPSIPVPRPTLLTILGWCGLCLAVKSALGRRRWAGRLTLVSLISLIVAGIGLLPSHPPEELRLRLVVLPTEPLVWVSTPERWEVLLLSRESQLPSALRMLRTHGVAHPHLVLTRDRTVYRDYPAGRGVVSVGPGQVQFRWGDLSFVWGTGPVPRLQGTVVGLPEDTWDLREQGPLELRSEGGGRLRCGPWL
ncbi:MAG: ComEC/Rec2 family competence protein [Candidatus Eremiobacterota bacterium]